VNIVTGLSKRHYKIYFLIILWFCGAKRVSSSIHIYDCASCGYNPFFYKYLAPPEHCNTAFWVIKFVIAVKKKCKAIHNIEYWDISEIYGKNFHITLNVKHCLLCLCTFHPKILSFSFHHFQTKPSIFGIFEYLNSCQVLCLKDSFA